MDKENVSATVTVAVPAARVFDTQQNDLARSTSGASASGSTPAAVVTVSRS